MTGLQELGFTTGSVAGAGIIDRDDPTPYYAQLAKLLRTKIERGDWKPRDRLPSEAELGRSHDLSRTVVRQALGLLVSEGLIYRRKGKGTFVAEPKLTAALIQRLESFYDEMAARRRPPVSRILILRSETANGEVASALGIPVGATAIHLQRLRYVDEEPIVLSTSFLPGDLFAGLLDEDLTRVSLYGILERKFGYRIASGIRQIEALAATRSVAKMLSVTPGAPLLVVRSTTYLADGRACDYSVAMHRADRTRLEAHLVRKQGGSIEPPT